MPRFSSKKNRRTKKDPSYRDMITEAIYEDGKSKGTSRQSITKYIVTNYGIDETVVRNGIRKSIRDMLEDEDADADLIQDKGYFKMSAGLKDEWKKYGKERMIKNVKISKSAKRKKRRAPKIKDPNAPKKTRSAWVYYGLKKRKELSKANPGASFGEVTRMLGEDWHALSDSKRKKYELMSDIDRKRYLKQMKAYNKRKALETSSEETSENSDSSNSSDHKKKRKSKKKSRKSSSSESSEDKPKKRRKSSSESSEDQMKKKKKGSSDSSKEEKTKKHKKESSSESSGSHEEKKKKHKADNQDDKSTSSKPNTETPNQDK